MRRLGDSGHLVFQLGRVALLLLDAVVRDDLRLV